MNAEPLYERLGGWDNVTDAAELFYRKGMADPQLRPLLESTPNVRQSIHRIACLTVSFGDASWYLHETLTGQLPPALMRSEDFDAAFRTLLSALDDLNVDEIAILHIARIAATVRSMMVPDRIVH